MIVYIAVNDVAGVAHSSLPRRMHMAPAFLNTDLSSSGSSVGSSSSPTFSSSTRL